MELSDKEKRIYINLVQQRGMDPRQALELVEVMRMEERADQMMVPEEEGKLFNDASGMAEGTSAQSKLRSQLDSADASHKRQGGMMNVPEEELLEYYRMQDKMRKY